MTVNYPKLNQIVAPIAASVPDVVPLLEQIDTCPGTRHVAVALVDAFFSIPVHKNHQKQSAFSGQASSTPLPFYLKSMLVLQPCVLTLV